MVCQNQFSRIWRHNGSNVLCASISINTNSHLSKVFSSKTNGCLGWGANRQLYTYVFSSVFSSFTSSNSISRSKITICCYQWLNSKKCHLKIHSEVCLKTDAKSLKQRNHNHIKTQNVIRTVCVWVFVCLSAKYFILLMRPRHKSSSHPKHVFNWFSAI